MNNLDYQFKKLKDELFDWDDFFRINNNVKCFSKLKLPIKKNWSWVILKPGVFLDYDAGCLGFDALRSIENNQDSDSIVFVLTEFENMDNPPSIWCEKYSSSSISDSSEESWQFAMSGLFFAPDNMSWFGLYVDDPELDFILFCAPNQIIDNKKFKNSFDDEVIEVIRQ